MEQEFRFEKGAEGMASGVGPERSFDVAFSRHDGIYRSDVELRFLQTWPGFTAFRPGPDQVLKRAGRKHAYPLSQRVPAGYSSNGLLASIARLRFTGIRNLTCTFHKPRQKGDISTLPAGGHFYFALTLPSTPAFFPDSIRDRERRLILVTWNELLEELRRCDGQITDYGHRAGQILFDPAVGVGERIERETSRCYASRVDHHRRSGSN